MKKINIQLLSLVLLILPLQALSAQNGGILFSAGMASSRMDDLKLMQEYILDTYPVDGKTTSSFPPFTCMSITAFKQLYDQIKVGGGYSYATTGGKSSYADYSGTIFTEMNAASHRLGAYLSYTVLGNGNGINLSVYGKAEANLTRLIIKSSYDILNVSNTNSNRYRSISPSGTVGSEIMYGFKDFSVGIDAGYMVDLTAGLHHTDRDESLSHPEDREQVLSADWTGWHLKIKAMIWLGF